MFICCLSKRHKLHRQPNFLLDSNLILNYKQISPLDMLLCQKVVETPHHPI